jgi:hypothetical protein
MPTIWDVSLAWQVAVVGSTIPEYLPRISGRNGEEHKKKDILSDIVMGLEAVSCRCNPMAG